MSEGKRALAASGLPAEQVHKFQGQWLETKEEVAAALLAAGATPEQVEQEGVPADWLADGPRVARPAAFRLGCRVSATALETFKRNGTLRKLSGAPTSSPFGAKLPSSVRLMDKLPEVRNQWDRGTCVSFATCALREFLAEDGVDLSEQYLYWACKELDGIPDEEGTFIRTAITALDHYGVCGEEAWPYCPTPCVGNEGQGPVPEEAAAEAGRYRLPAARPVEPTLVKQYKHVLAGSDKAAGMPVVFAVLVFDSWFASEETRRTGKMPMPFSWEEPQGGHAMCAVGYVDDERVPGGGYFIVRNSWGKEWAAESPEAPGHALMPYAYVERCASEAFTGGNAVVERAQKPEAFSAAGAVSSEGERAMDGERLRAGIPVLRDVINPGVFKKDTPANRTEYDANDHTWSRETREKVWLENLRGMPQGTAKGDGKKSLSGEDSQRNRTLARRAAFEQALQENMASTVDARVIYPYKSLPFWLWLLPVAWNPKVRSASVVADLDAELATVLCTHTGVPAALQNSAVLREVVGGLSEMRVYEVKGVGDAIHVVTAFLTPLRVKKGSDAVFAKVGQAELSAVEAVYQAWLAGTGTAHAARRVVYSLGSAQPMEDASRDMCRECGKFFFAQAKDASGWRFVRPDRVGDRPAMQKFLRYLEPETDAVRFARIKAVVDECLNGGGNVTAERIAARAAELNGGETFETATIVSAMCTLQEENEASYRLYRSEQTKQLAIRKAKPMNDPVRIRTGKPRWHAVCLFLLQPIMPTVLAVLWLTFCRNHPDAMQSIGWALLGYYVYNCLAALMRRYLF